MNYRTIKETAEKWGVSVRWVQTMCKNGLINGAVKWERSWMIPENAEKPIDGRTKTAKQASDGLPHLPLPRKCPPLFMTDLYNAPGTAEESVKRLSNQPEAAALLEAWFAYGRGDIDKVLEHAQYFLSAHSGFNAVISGGMLLALCAMWQGDIKLWRQAKMHIYETPVKNEDEYESLRFWLAATDSAMYDANEFPHWFKIGRFRHLHPQSLSAARFFYVKHLFISASDLALGEIELQDVTNLGLMRTFPYIVEPMISHAAAEKMIILEIFLRFLCAAAYHNIGDDENAIYHIDIALSLALPDKLYGILAEHRRPLDGLMDERLALIDPEALKKLKKLHKQMIHGWVKLHNELYKSSITNVFSPREREAAKLAAFGLSDKEIAMRLGIAVSSVKSMITMAKNKTGAQSRADLGAYV